MPFSEIYEQFMPDINTNNFTVYSINYIRHNRSINEIFELTLTLDRDIRNRNNPQNPFYQDSDTEEEVIVEVLEIIRRTGTYNSNNRIFQTAFHNIFNRLQNITEIPDNRYQAKIVRLTRSRSGNCSICLDNLLDIYNVVQLCSNRHVVHKLCYDLLVDSPAPNRCPLCRQEFKELQENSFGRLPSYNQLMRLYVNSRRRFY